MCADVFFWRQIFILAASVCYAFSIGFMVSYPAVLNAAILSPNSTDIRTTPSHASWIASSNGFAGIFGFFILSPVMQKLGRKWVNITCSASLLVGWVIFPLANGIGYLYAARIIQSLAVGGFYMHGIILCEYADPKRRGYFMTVVKLATAIGTLVCHAMSVWWDWRQISLFATFPPALGIILTFFWPESPSHLAMKGRYEECKESYKWIFGESAQVQGELNLLISAQTERRKDTIEKRSVFKSLLKKLTKRDFVRSFFIVSLLTIIIDLCGRYFFVAYVIQIMVELLEDQSLAVQCSIGADCLIIVALFASSFIIRLFKRRPLLFIFGAVSILVMLLFSLLVYLRITYDVLNFKWLSPCIILLHNFIVNIGVIPVCFALIGEVFPLEHKGLGSCAAGVVYTLFYAWTLKLTPVFIDAVGLHGTYALFGVSLAVCFVILYFILPETKDKSLTEIEYEMKSIKTSTKSDKEMAILL